MNPSSYYAYNYYLQRGYSPQAAAGITGNLMVESGRFAPDVISGARRGDAGSAAYAAQWRGERLNNFHSYARQNGMDPNSLDAQLGFVDHEMRTGLDAGAGRAFRELQQARDPASAAQAFMRHYERPHADPSINHIATRQQYANNLYGAQPQTVAQYKDPMVSTPNYNPAAAQAAPANMSAAATAAPTAAAQTGIATLGPQAVAQLPTVQDAAMQTVMPAVTQAATQQAAAAAAPAADPMGGLFGLLMSARMAGGGGGESTTEMTVPRPKMVDNRSPDQKMASVSQTPNVYEERLRRRA